jgi:hypothetical protein
MRSITEQLTSRVVNEIITEAEYEGEPMGRPELDANAAGYASPPQTTNPYGGWVPGGAGGGAVPTSFGNPRSPEDFAPPPTHDDYGNPIKVPDFDITNYIYSAPGWWGSRPQSHQPIWHPGRYLPDSLRKFIPRSWGGRLGN